MLGLVMWSDTRNGKAVIWCEDHGDLAFYRPCASDQPVAMSAGDWVEFDDVQDSDQRIAQNPRPVETDDAPAGQPRSLSHLSETKRQRIELLPMRRILDLRRAEEFRELGLCRAEA